MSRQPRSAAPRGPRGISGCGVPGRSRSSCPHGDIPRIITPEKWYAETLIATLSQRVCSRCRRGDPAQNRSLCISCLSGAQRRRKTWLSAGVCNRCSKIPPEAGKLSCRPCLDLAKAWHAAQLYETCRRCGATKQKARTKYCTSCNTLQGRLWAQKHGKRIRHYVVCHQCRQPMSKRRSVFCSGKCQREQLRARVKNTGCMHCHEKHPAEMFATTGYCNPCNNERKRQAWTRTSKAQRKAKQMRDAKHPEVYARSRKKFRLAVLKHYGGHCACCGEGEFEFLAIDHINGGGAAHRRTFKGPIERWLTKNNFPAGFRVLCHNCNFALGRYGYCPHDKSPHRT